MSEDNIELLELKKTQLSEINAQISDLNKKKAWVTQEIFKLDAVKQAEFKKTRSKQKFAEMSRKQDMVFEALRKIGKPVTAGPICKEFKKIGYELHSSFFASQFLESVRKDKRVVVTKINASKNKYSLKIWE
jgi:hypothetical protein